MARFIPPSECPVCGNAVPKGAKACPGCGADERTGWNPDGTLYDGVDLPDSAFEAEAKPPLPRRPAFLWVVVAIIVLCLMILGMIGWVA